MARVTVEDCTRQVPSRFELILMAATRSRQISSGQPLLIERDNDRDPIVALREIADGKITAEEMNEKIITDLSRPTGMDETSIEERKLLQPDASEMSEEEMLQSLTALEAKTSQASPYMISTDEEVDFEKPKQDMDEPIDEMPIDAVSMELRPEGLSSDELRPEGLPSDELRPEGLSINEMPTDVMPTDAMPTDAMIAAEEIRIAEEEADEKTDELRPEGLPSDELPSDELPSDELPSDEETSDEEANEPPNSDDTPI